MTQQSDTTLSDKYDAKLRSELYVSMLTLQDKCADIHIAERKADEDALEKHILALLDEVPKAVTAYFLCIEGGTNV